MEPEFGRKDRGTSVGRPPSNPITPLVFATVTATFVAQPIYRLCRFRLVIAKLAACRVKVGPRPSVLATQLD